MGCIWPHKWSPWYPGKRFMGYEHLYRKTKRCRRCGKEKIQCGFTYIACTSWEYRELRAAAGID